MCPAFLISIPAGLDSDLDDDSYGEYNLGLGEKVLVIELLTGKELSTCDIKYGQRISKYLKKNRYRIDICKFVNFDQRISE